LRRFAVLNQKLSIWFVDADTKPLLSEDIDGIGHSVFMVTGLSSSGVVLKADGLTEAILGETLTAAELARLNFAPAFRCEGAPFRSSRPTVSTRPAAELMSHSSHS
jgi:hypothetical protein